MMTSVMPLTDFSKSSFGIHVLQSAGVGEPIPVGLFFSKESRKVEVL